MYFGVAISVHEKLKHCSRTKTESSVMLPPSVVPMLENDGPKWHRQGPFVT